MLFIISLGTKARAGGVFSQREFIVSTISALVHHYSSCHLGKSHIVYLFCNERDGFSGAFIFHGICFILPPFSSLLIEKQFFLFHSPITVMHFIDSFHCHCDQFDIWLRGDPPSLKELQPREEMVTFFIILVSFVISFHCRCDQFQF